MRRTVARRQRRSRARGGNLYPEAMNVPRTPRTLFPAEMTVDEKYTEVRNLQAVSGAYAFEVFRMNSTFDPDFTFVGTQPYMRDQLAGIYTKYRVNAFGFDVRAVIDPGTSAVGRCAVIGCAPCPNTSTNIIVQNLANLPFGKFGIVQYGGPAAVMRGNILIREFLGQTRPVFLSDDSNESVAGSNPTQACFFHIGTQNTNADTTTVNYIVCLTYNVTWFAPINMGAS